MISVANSTSLDMFWDVKLNFSQLLKAHVYDSQPFDFHFSNEKVPSSKKQNKTKKKKQYGVLDSVRQR